MSLVLYPLDSEDNEILNTGAGSNTTAYHESQPSFVTVQRYVNAVRTTIKKGMFHVQLGSPDGDTNSRYKNRSFMRTYGLWKREDQIDFLLKIEPEDFCHKIDASDGSELYVFCIEATLYKEACGLQRVRVYVKHNYPAPGTSDDVIISLHALEKAIELPFRD